MRSADSRPEQRNVCTKLASPLHAFFTARGLPGAAEHVYGEGEIAELGQPLSTRFDELTNSPRLMYDQHPRQLCNPRRIVHQVPLKSDPVVTVLDCISMHFS